MEINMWFSEWRAPIKTNKREVTQGLLDKHGVSHIFTDEHHTAQANFASCDVFDGDG